jgi:class 3 adenylate cyclase/tetratricopeptide (TPR) repeat protein
VSRTSGKDDAERKQVTVLFADVKGSMDLAEQQDPEEWRKIMQRFFSILAEGVERFEGTVDKFTGDGIMAVFGAPIAHEDHARRAGYAALQMLDDVSEYAAELRREQGLNFSVRIGINSGEVVAGQIGGGGESGGDYTAIGHTVGLAQRMEALAEPGKAYLTESAAELAGGFVELEDLGEFEIKGASRPVRVFELAGVGRARSRLDLSRARGFSRFVGREQEMASFEQALSVALEGRGSAVAVVADPGTGKSRLCHEFAERCRQNDIEVFEAQAQAHGKEIPFMPVLQMLRAYFGIDDRDPERLAREKIAGRALLLDPSLAESLPLIFDFLGVPDPDRPAPTLSAEARQRALAEFVSHLVNSPERKKAVVLVVEDLHWIDDGSASMLGELFNTLCDSPTMLVVNYRPEFDLTWGDDVTLVELQPLSDENTRELLRDLAGEDPSLDGLPDLVHQRTQGNPFFIEEIVRELAEAGFLEGARGAYTLARPIEDAGVPATVQAILSARIDRLGPDAKRLLQVASVVGKELGIRELSLTAEIELDQLDEVLAELTRGGFLYEAELYPEKVLAFQHPLTREVAYGTQLGERREETHAAAARAIVELEPERHDELAALIAQHMESGGEVREAARWSARAAHWSGSSQPAEAMRLWHATSRLADQLPEDDEVAALRVMSRLQQLDYAWRLGMDDAEERRLAEEAAEIAERTNNLPALAMLKMATSARPGLVNHVDEWKAAADEATRIADESGDIHLRVSMRAAGAYARLCSGEFSAYAAMLDEVLELSGGDPVTGAGLVIGNPVAFAHMGKGTVHKERGEFDAADAELELALESSSSAQDPETESWIIGMQAMLRTVQGDGEAGVSVARRGYEIAERLGDAFSRALALSNLGWAEMEVADYEAGLQSVEEADRLYREAMGVGGEMEGWRGSLRAECLRGLGRSAEALEAAESAVAACRERGINWGGVLGLQALGRAKVACGDDEGAARTFDEALEMARANGATLSMERIEEDQQALAARSR